MKEIEVKAKIIDEVKLRTQFESLGYVFSEPNKQEDTIYVNFTHKYTDFVPGVTQFLRIRRQGEKILFTFKEPQTNELDCIEYETEIQDPEALSLMLLRMGYHSAVEVTKIRQKATLGSRTVCLDRVEGLGSFVEVEELIDSSSAETVQEALFCFLEELGIKKEARVTHGYDTLLWLQNSK